MREATANYLQEEARPRGAKPRVRAVIYPFDLDLGMAGTGGTFVNTEYIGAQAGTPAPRLAMQAGYFLTGSWVSPVMQAYTPNLVVPSWVDQAGYMTVVVSIRTAATYEGVAGAAWTAVASGGEYDLGQYYQVKVELISAIRAWAVDEAGDADAYSAYAVDVSPDPGYDSYASDGEFPGNLQDFLLTGKVLLPESEIHNPGDVSLEMSLDFQNLRTGSNRLVVDNRSRQWIPGGPNFYLRAIPWYKKQLKLYHGYELPSGQVEWQLVYIGQLQTLSEMGHAWEGAHLAHLETEDFIRTTLDKKIGVPDADGTKRPFMRGYYRAKAESTGTTDAACTVVKTGSGAASLHVVDGTKYSGLSDVNYLVQADSTGEVGAATFRWSKDNGQTWEKTGITTKGQGNQVTLENGLEIYWESAPGTDLTSGDQWLITAVAKVVHYRIPGAPFQAITAVWVQDDDSRQGVTFSENSGEINVKGNAGSVEARVVKDDTTHPVDIIEDILAAVGLSEFLNADAFALAKSDTLFYHVGVCFGDLEAGRAIREICSRCLYDFWVDCGEIKIRAYLGD